jgi:hypothetical protein
MSIKNTFGIFVIGDWLSEKNPKTENDWVSKLPYDLLITNND